MTIMPAETSDRFRDCQAHCWLPASRRNSGTDLEDRRL